MKLALTLGNTGIVYLSQRPPNKPIWLLRGGQEHQASLLLQQHCIHRLVPRGFNPEQTPGCVANKLLLA